MRIEKVIALSVAENNENENRAHSWSEYSLQSSSFCSVLNMFVHVRYLSYECVDLCVRDQAKKCLKAIAKRMKKIVFFFTEESEYKCRERECA